MSRTGIQVFFIENNNISFQFAEIKDCYEKSKRLESGCDFIKCFHERYRCNDESVTAWAHELCQQFPEDVIMQFTPPVKQFLIFLSL